MSALWHQHGKLRKAMAAVLVGALVFTGMVLALRLDGANGNITKKNGKLTVDVTNEQEGYFTACCTASQKKMKLRVAYGDEQLTYDLNNSGLAEAFPFQFGSGKYVITLYENTGGKKYAQAGKVSLTVALEDERAAFLRPNQYVNYTDETAAVRMIKDACDALRQPAEEKSEIHSPVANILRWSYYATRRSAVNKEQNARVLTDEEIFDAVKTVMGKNFTYDYILAVTVQVGTLPNIEQCCEKRMGICQDLAATAVCMLRSQGVYAKLIIGYADSAYHAWVVAYINGEEVLYDPTVATNAMRAPAAYTMERFY